MTKPLSVNNDNGVSCYAIYIHFLKEILVWIKEWQEQNPYQGFEKLKEHNQKYQHDKEVWVNQNAPKYQLNEVYIQKILKTS